MNWADAQDSLPPDTDVFPADHAYLIRKQFIALFKKFEFLPKESGLNPEEKAISSFLAAEHRCRRVNLKFKVFTLLRRDAPDDRRKLLSEILEVARREILDVLGEAPRLKEIYQKCDFSGGASIGVHGDATNIGRKLLSEDWSVTPTCASYAFEALRCNNQFQLLFGRSFGFEKEIGDPMSGQSFAAIGDGLLMDQGTFLDYFSSKIRYVQYNQIAFVPKTAKTHRAIAVEPLLNGFVQKGIDSYIRELLKHSRYRIDLSDQTKNQKWAKWGSLEEMRDPFVTLDLSAASDSISIALVKRLLPPEWFVLLNATRSPSYLLNGVVRRYNKFCSMGNGFCFPLETLIFAAISAACYRVMGQRPQISVYGDDIIVRQNIALLVTETLNNVGFKVNRDKSFYHGPFRESCGADWVRGRDVTPVYMRKRVDSLTKLVNFHNSLYFKCFGSTDIFSGVTQSLRELAPADCRYLELHRPTQVPLNTGFLVEHDEFMASPHTVWVPEYGTWLGSGLRSTPVSDDFGHPLRTQVEYLAVLRGASSGQPLSLRRETKTRVSLDSHACAYLGRAQEAWWFETLGF
jgi:DNA-binding transcriptional ArsR family regulator